MASEYYSYIIWHNALENAEKIINHIMAKPDMKVRQAWHINWSTDLFPENMSRFYGKNLPADSNKVSHCGAGPFVLLLLEDLDPVFGYRHTSKGFDYLNTKLFDLKSESRHLTGGGHRIHTANTEAETRHDVILLLGKTLTQVVEELPDDEWQGDIQPVERNLSGARGWDNLEQLFSVLNECLNYVVLRNFDILPDQFYAGEHGDIDLLVEHFAEAMFLTNARNVFSEDYRVHVAVNIAGDEVRFDFRFLGDNYYEPLWEKTILDKRVYNSKGFYHPDPINYFYTLLYHALIHKRQVAADYTEKLTAEAEKLGLENSNYELFSNRQHMLDLLNRFMLKNQYRYTRPDDKSVNFNQSSGNQANTIKDFVTALISQSNKTKPLYSKKNGYFASKVWKVQLPDGRYGALKRVSALDPRAKPLLFNEGNILRLMDHPQIVKIILDGNVDDEYFIITEWIDGTNLEENETSLIEQMDDRTKQEFLARLKDIHKHIKDRGIMHRDIWQRNILVKDNLPYLIDFGWATSSNMDDPFLPPELRQPDDNKATKSLTQHLASL
jgi:predicted Ser/Thr protein kinase